MSVSAETTSGISEQQVEIQWQPDLMAACPQESQIRLWACAAIDDISAQVTIRVVDSSEIQASNNQWRGIDKPTNVLSFPADFPTETGIKYLGDLLVCAEVLERERIEQQKPSADHWGHIIVHGVLHLQGYDHENDRDAEQMEQREREILATLGIPDPYAGENL